MIGRNVRRFTAALAVAAALHLAAPIPAAAGPPSARAAAAAQGWLAAGRAWIAELWGGLGATWATQEGEAGLTRAADGSPSAPEAKDPGTDPGSGQSAQGDEGGMTGPDG